MKPSSQARLVVPEPLSAQIYTKPTMLRAKKDFISKLEIALKEASETDYWLELLYKTNYIDEQTFKSLSKQCASIRVMRLLPVKQENKTSNQLD